eukprot:scaffold57323_cov67-Phaeocystis_antarctica.AAC.1
MKVLNSECRGITAKVPAARSSAAVATGCQGWWWGGWCVTGPEFLMLEATGYVLLGLQATSLSDMSQCKWIVHGARQESVEGKAGRQESVKGKAGKARER